MSQKERSERWRKKNKEHIKKYRKKYYENNKEKEAKNWKIWYKNHKEKKAEKDKEWENKNLTERKRYQKIWRRTETGKAHAQRGNNKRRAKEREIINTLTSEEWLNILERFNYKCAYCECKLNEKNPPTRDHIIPISKGGNNIKKNIVPACRSCNAKKNNKILITKGDE